MEALLLPPSRRSVRTSALVVALLAGICFARVVTFDFAYDDQWTIVNNRFLVRDLADLVRSSLIGRASAAGMPDATRPAMVVSMWVDRQVFGLSPGGYHLHSLVLYAVTSGLAVFAAFGISRDRIVAFVAGCFFAVAPVHAEAVASVNYREDLIAGSGVLAALACLLAYRRSSRPYGVAAAAFLWTYALLGKENAVALVLLLSTAGLCSARCRRRLLEQRIALSVFGLVLMTWTVWRVWLRASGRDDVPLTLSNPSALDRLLRTCRYLVRVVVDSVLPVFWSPDHAPGGSASPFWVLGLVGLVGAIILLVRRRSTRLAGVGLAIALVSSLPTSPLLGPINERADRYLFLSVLGAGLFWGWGAQRIAPWIQGRSRAAVFALPLFALLWTSQAAAAAWENDETLWAAAVRRSPRSARAWTGQSRMLRLAGRLDEAEHAVARAIALEPKFWGARVTRIHTLIRRGAVEEARLEIADVQRRGGGRQRGMRRAVRCAALPRDAAAACIDEGFISNPTE